MIDSRADKHMRGAIWLPSYLFAITVLSSLPTVITILSFLVVMLVLDKMYLNIFKEGFYFSKRNWLKFLIVIAFQLGGLTAYFNLIEHYLTLSE